MTFFYSPTVFTRCYSREDSYNEPIRYYLEQARPHLERAGRTLQCTAWRRCLMRRGRMSLSSGMPWTSHVPPQAEFSTWEFTGWTISFALARGEKLGGEIQRLCGDYERLLELLGELLGQHPDYSLNATMERMRGAHPVNPAFELALKAQCGQRVLPILYF